MKIASVIDVLKANLRLVYQETDLVVTQVLVCPGCNKEFLSSMKEYAEVHWLHCKSQLFVDWGACLVETIEELNSEVECLRKQLKSIKPDSSKDLRLPSINECENVSEQANSITTNGFHFYRQRKSAFLATIKEEPEATILKKRKLEQYTGTHVVDDTNVTGKREHTSPDPPIFSCIEAKRTFRATDIKNLLNNTSTVEEDTEGSNFSSFVKMQDSPLSSPVPATEQVVWLTDRQQLMPSPSLPSSPEHQFASPDMDSFGLVVGPKNSPTKEEGKEKSYNCEICGNVFRNRRGLEAHRLTHSEEKPFICHTCGYACRNSGSLHIHNRIHTGEKPFVCDICGDSFRQRAHLDAHKRIHTDEKPFVCDICGYACRNSGSLNTHKSIHTQTKRFVCEICGFASKWKSALNVHKRRHTDEKPFVCDICSFSCRQSGVLNAHKRIHKEHSKLPVE